MQIKRDKYLEQLIEARDNGFVKIVTGLRRVGKSYLLFELFYNYLISIGIKEEAIIKISLDNIENQKYRDVNKLYDYLNNKIDQCKYEKKYILIDEIQFVKSKVDNETNEKISFHHLLISLMKKADIYVTGSNSKMLAKDIVTEFRGRGQQIRVFPLSFKEFISYNPNNIDLDSLWKLFYTYGSLPQTILFQNDLNKIDYLKNLYLMIYIKDIIERYKIKNDEYILNTTAKILSSNIGSLTNALNISNTFNSEMKIKISSSTIKQYISHFIDSFIINETLKYDIKGKKFISSPSKLYFSDCGIRNAIIEFNDLKLPKLLENIVYNELIYRGYIVSTGSIEKFYKDDNNLSKRKYLEVDFIASKLAKKIYIQVVDSINTEQKLEQEMQSLKEIKNEFKKIFIVNNKFDHYIDDNGIHYYSIFDFLLDNKWEDS